MKKLSIICLLLAALLVLTSCGAKKSETPIELPACQTVGEAILQGQTFTEEMLAISEEKLIKALDLNAEDFTDVYMSMDASRATPECVIVVTAKDEEAQDTITKKLSAYRDDTLREYQDYRPDEAPKLKDALVLQHGLQCVLAVCADQKAAMKSCQDTWEK